MANYSLSSLFLFLLSIICTAWTASIHEFNDDLLIRQAVVSDGLDDHLSLSKFEHQFSEFKKKYNKVYDTEEENDFRFGVFMSNLLRARRHQKLNPSATHGVTKFSDLTPSEFNGKLFVPDYIPIDILDAPILQVDDLQTRKDWRDSSAVTRVKDQGSCKAGRAFSVVGILESVRYQRSTSLQDLSAQQLLDCDRNCNPQSKQCDKGCDGGFTYNALKYVSKAGGIMAEADYAYTGTSGNVCQFNTSRIVQSISKIYYIPPREDQIAAYVAKKNPVVVFVDSQYFQSYTGGIYCPPCRAAGTHGVLLVGYDTDRNWTLKNSLGANWGENGYFRLCKGGLTCTDQVDLDKIPVKLIPHTQHTRISTYKV